MTEQQNILTELRELQSSLPYPAPAGYTVPAGYFDDFANKILLLIKEDTGVSPEEELAQLSPLLSSLSKKMPYTTPAGYFEEINIPLKEVPEEELSPMLADLSRQSPYKVPTGYFEELPAVILRKAKAQQQPAKVIPISRKLYRYAAAAVITGIVATLSIIMVKKPSAESGDITSKWVSENAKAVNSLLELADSESNVPVKPAAMDDLAQLVKGIPEKEIQDFLNETQIGENELNAEDDLLLN